MSNLSATAKLATNPEVRDKVAAAIRNAAAGKYAASGKAGRLARVALLDPTIPLEHLLVRIAADATITGPACPACGHAWETDGGTPIDDAISYVVDTQWDAVAEIIYPDASQV